MKVELVTITEKATQIIENFGKVSIIPEIEITDDSHKTFCKELIKRNFTSPLEHASATFHIIGISRATSHQLVRHRLASFTQKSQLFTNKEDFPKYIPPSIADHQWAWKEYNKAIDICADVYNTLIREGFSWEDARMVLPNAQLTDITVTANFREWRHILKTRTSKECSAEMRFMSYRILKILKTKYPNIFEDLWSEEK